MILNYGLVSSVVEPGTGTAGTGALAEPVPDSVPPQHKIFKIGKILSDFGLDPVPNLDPEPEPEPELFKVGTGT